MANTIIPKRSSVVGKVPLSTDLEVGELAVNLADGLIFSKNAAGTVISLGGGTSGITSGQVTTALGFTPANVAGDTFSGNVLVNAGTDSRTLLQVSGVTQAQFQATASAIRLSSNNTTPLVVGTNGVDRVTFDSVGNTTFGSAQATGVFRVQGQNSGDMVVFESTDASATAAPDFVLYRNSSSPVAGDQVGNILFRGKDSGGADQSYARILSTIADPTAGAEEGDLRFGVQTASGFFDLMTLTSVGLGVSGTVSATSFSGSGASLTGLTSGQVTTALGFTPYDAANPSGYTSNVGDVTLTGTQTLINKTLDLPKIATNNTNGSAGVLAWFGTTLRYGDGAVERTVANTDSTQTLTNKTLSTGSAWQGNVVGVPYGGTGLSTIAALSIPVANTLNTLSALSVAAGESIRVNAGGTAWEAFTPGGSGGSGTVTSVGLSMPTIFTTTGSPVTSSGTLTATLANQTANTVFAAPNGSTGAPTFRALVAADIPALTLENIPDAWVKKSVRVATTANITLSGTQTIDGVAVAVGDRVLVKNQTTTSANGIYVVASTAWSRAADANTSSELAAASVGVDSGATNGGFTFDCDFKSTDTLGTTAMSWGKVLDSNGANVDYVAPSGTGTITNKTISAYTNTISGFPAQTVVTTDINGNIDAAAARRAFPSGTIIGSSDLQTMTNKTLTSPTINTPTIAGAVLNNGYTEEVLAITGTAPALTPTTASIQTWALTANSTPTAGTWAAGQSLTLLIDDGTARIINWGSLAVTWKTNGGSAPTLNLTGYTVIHLWKVGTVIYGARVGDA